MRDMWRVTSRWTRNARSSCAPNTRTRADATRDECDEQVDEKRAVELRETFSRPTHERAPMPPAVASDSTPPRRAGWAQEKARWRSSILDCPLLGDARRAVRARAALAFFVVAWTSYDLVDSLVGDDGVPYYFIFLTNWAACISVAYVLTAVYAARLAARSPPRDPDDHESGPRPDADTGADPPPRVVHAMWLVKAPALVAQLFVTIMYWALLYRPSYGPVTATNVATHGIICAGLIFDHAARIAFASAGGSILPRVLRLPPHLPRVQRPVHLGHSGSDGRSGESVCVRDIGVEDARESRGRRRRVRGVRGDAHLFRVGDGDFEAEGRLVISEGGGERGGAAGGDGGGDGDDSAGCVTTRSDGPRASRAAPWTRIDIGY